MKNDYTHITVILDRSGSMESIRDDTIGGFNTFLQQQKSEPGTATLSLVQFDSQDSYEIIHNFQNIVEIPQLKRDTFVPRSCTPLLDAMGRGINDLEHHLTTLKEDDRPARIIMVIITDGQENASKEFRKGQVENMIREKQKKYDWQFVYLSADLAAVDDALQTGIATDSVMSFDKNASGTAAAWGAVSARIADYRSARCKKVSFCDDDRNQQQSEQFRK